MRCNTDIKYISSGKAAKALVYYVTDYITKCSLPIHVSFDALRYAVKQNGMKYLGANNTQTAKNCSLFTKAVNAIMAWKELSHQQVMSYLVGCGDCYKFTILSCCVGVM
ncbi:hypothetical protein SERLA73DRAFT_47931 [Serpula lacrymans var. lacrymans S7.3]|uniref:Uncharacterized protein n=1 Tax=Serpula lacrymans var. lacrymans (strain S7.3) TaxID=936435 RepID=F8PLQ4_SERL3|nr:hypothetical protein SERLA73DRAFT_47931 [Serpula lacrymans var. lacrymans S7.3]